MASGAVDIDDYDAHAIDYQNPSLWSHQVGRQNVQGGTYTAGYTNAVAKLTFSGTEVMVFGVANPPPKNSSSLPPLLTFFVDGGLPNQVGAPSRLDAPQFSYRFFNSGPLNPGQHTLQILVNNGENDWPFVLDYVQYIPLTPSTTASPTLASGSSDTLSSDPSATTALLAANLPKKSTNAGAIAGAVVAGIGGLALIICGFWFYFFRLRKRAAEAHNHDVTKVDMFEQGKAYTGGDQSYGRPSYGPNSMYVPTEPSRAFSSEFMSRPSSPSLSHTRPATPSATPHRPGTPPVTTSRPGTPLTVLHPIPTTLHPPGGTAPVVPSPLGKPALAEADSASVRSAGPAAVFHADSGIRFAPSTAASSHGGGQVEGRGDGVAFLDVAELDVPPEYTES
ncbi:hypothetical protein C8Q77DRAFT_1070731 [Trametes polyzona]|nr:hypothetical protein C8Q77DRAFT_1070731 [Trametes polyzona]